LRTATAILLESSVQRPFDFLDDLGDLLVLPLNKVVFEQVGELPDRIVYRRIRP
jgi:hypothetical protein